LLKRLYPLHSLQFLHSRLLYRSGPILCSLDVAVWLRHNRTKFEEKRGGDVSWYVPTAVMLAADKLTQLVYRATGGRLGERQLRYSMLLLHTVGRKSGKQRTHTLLYFRDGEDLVICASNNGAPRPPAWHLNLLANPRVPIQHGRVKREVLAETVGPEERERLWQRLLEVRPQFADYQKSTSRIFPLIRLKPLPAEQSTPLP
jgi:deazaflavin-dependent oxidoreductase (nitroreductase family)